MRGNKNRLIPVALRVNQILVKLPCTLAYLPDRLASRSSRKGKRLLIKQPDRAADRGILWIPDANSVPLSPVDLPDSGVPKNTGIFLSPIKIRAVSRALERGLDIARSKGTSSNALAVIRASSLPFLFRGVSCSPCIRRSWFQSVSPCLTIYSSIPSFLSAESRSRSLTPPFFVQFLDLFYLSPRWAGWIKF